MARATYLPAISSMMTNFWDSDTEIAQQADFLNGDGCYTYPRTLVSAAHINRQNPNKAYRLKNRKDNTFLFVDSGGYQIYGGVVKFDFKDFHCKANNDLKQEIFDFQNDYGDAAATFEIGYPAQIKRPELGLTDADCLRMTIDNLDFWANQPEHKAIFCNVLQAKDVQTAYEWYDAVKDYDFCKGYSFAAVAARNIPIMLRLLLKMREEGREPKHLHVLGQSKPMYTFLLNSVTHALSEHWWHDVEFTYDSSTFIQDAVRGRVCFPANYHSKEQIFKTSIRPIPVPEQAYNSDLPVPVSGSIFKNMSMKEWLGAENTGKWQGYAYPMLAHANMEQMIFDFERMHSMFDVELLGYDSKSYEEWKVERKGFIHSDYFHAHNLIQEIIGGENWDLLEQYEHKLHKLSLLEGKDNEVFNSLFTI